MFGCKEKKKLKEICTTLELTSGGIYKRIDENRELLEFLAEESPEILQKNPWVVGWIRSTGEYLLATLHSMGMTLHKNNPRFPRPFPLLENCHNTAVRQEEDADETRNHGNR